MWLPWRRCRLIERGWAAIKSHVRDVYFMNSPNEPYGCDDRQGRAMFDQLGGTQVIRHI